MSLANRLARRPPMGWNSWDCYTLTVTEPEVRANADFMARHLRKFGYEYIVIDAGWYYTRHPDPRRGHAGTMCLDAWGRQLPASQKFPSAAGGRGFRPLADYIHGLGLKFGLHLMRGIPRLAVSRNLPVLGTPVRAQDIADLGSRCAWNEDMYGVDVRRAGAQEYYDSLFAQFAAWGVDYVKADDINWPYHAGEIEAIARARDRCGRPIVLSLSPGDGASEANAWHTKKHCELWRISGDIWDNWEQIKRQFERCRRWAKHIGSGHWPDADMLPIGRLCVRSSWAAPRPSRLAPSEQRTLMTLWCIFRSPLMIGGDLPTLDEQSLRLLTNPEVLGVDQRSAGNRELFSRGEVIAWSAETPGGSGRYVAFFNLADQRSHKVAIRFETFGLGRHCAVRDLWARKNLGIFRDSFAAVIASHDAGLYRIAPLGQTASRVHGTRRRG